MESIDVSKVIELDRTEDADEHIEIGWKLLELYTTCYDTIGPLIKHQTPHFILGWPSDSGEPKFPKSKWDFLEPKL